MRGIRRQLTATLIAAALSAAGMAMLAAFGGVDLSAGVSGGTIALAVMIMVAIASLWAAMTIIDGHFDDLAKLRADVLTAAPANPLLPRRWTLEGLHSPSEVTRLAQALEVLMGRQRRLARTPDQRLSAVVATLQEGLIVITDAGLISLVNSVAASLLGVDRVTVGTSIFAALERDQVLQATDRARQAARPLAVTLTHVDGTEMAVRVAALAGHGGAVLLFPVGVDDRHSEVHHDLALHDVPPPAQEITDDLPLDALPVLLLDTETTGLNVETDRIVSIGAVRAHGTRVYHNIVIDRLINPGIPIPKRSSAVHGITSVMVDGAPSFADIFSELMEQLQGVVVIGHNIGFDLSMLRAEAHRCGLEWHDPPTLDTGHIVCAMEPKLTDLNLDAIATEYGVEARGRHTALGDALVTAEIYTKLVTLLDHRGLRTFGDVKKFAASATKLTGLQVRAGWHDDPPRAADGRG